MKVLIHIKGGASSVTGELSVKDEDELVKFLEKKEFFVVKQEPPKFHPAVVATSSISYVERKQ